MIAVYFFMESGKYTRKDICKKDSFRIQEEATAGIPGSRLEGIPGSRLEEITRSRLEGINGKQA